MQSLLVVAQNTFRETVRDKILYNLVFFALLLIGASVLLGTLTIGEQSRIINDVGLAAINLVGVIMAIFVGIGLVSKEIERRTIYTILARPITRTQFVLGKYCGLVFIGGLNIAIMFVDVPVHDLAQRERDLRFVVPGGPTHVGGGPSRDRAGDVLFHVQLSHAQRHHDLGFYVIGHLTGDLKAIAEKTKNPATESIMTALYYVCPNLEWLNVKGQAAPACR